MTSHNIGKEIGNGAYSTVYKYKNKKCIKIFKDSIDIETVEFEYNLLSKLIHPNIITVYEQGKIENSNFIIMDYGGKSLRKVLNNNIKFDIKNTLLQIASAISYLHTRNYIHMDIKPDNIVMDSNGDVKLIDFNMVLNDCDIKEYYNDEFTVYFAPEILCKCHYSYAVDVWAFGCIIYELSKGSGLFQLFEFKEKNNLLCKHLLLLDIFHKIGISEQNNIKSLNFKKLPIELQIDELSGECDFSNIEPDLCSLLKKIFIYNKNKRITIKEILCDSYFTK